MGKEALAAEDAALDRANRRLAIRAMVLALLPTVVTQVAALVMAQIAASRYHRGGAPVAGASLARAARGVAVLMLLTSLTFIGWWVTVEAPSERQSEAEAHLGECKANLQRILTACRQFRDGPGGGQRFPMNWAELSMSGLADPGHLHCPVDAQLGRQSSYSYLGGLPRLVPADQFIVAYETYHNHRPDGEPGHLVVFADGTIEWVPNTRLQGLIRIQKRGPDG